MAHRASTRRRRAARGVVLVVRVARGRACCRTRGRSCRWAAAKVPAFCAPNAPDGRRAVARRDYLSVHRRRAGSVSSPVAAL